MHTTSPPASRATLLALGLGAGLLAQSAAGTELLINGDLESFSANYPDGWSFNPGSPPTSGPSAITSPFTGIYPAGSSSLALYDGPTQDLDPSLSQAFSPQTGQIDFAVDFRLDALSGSPWYFVVSGNHPTAGLSSGFLFWIDNATHELVADGLSGPSASLLTLTTGLWYHLQGTADIGTHTFSGAVTPYGSTAVSFSALPFNNWLVDLRQVGIDDGYTAGNGGTYRNGDILLDNLSIAVVPEPSSLALLAAGGMLLTACRGLRRAKP